MSRNKLYIILLIACLAGYGWLAFSNFIFNNESSPAEVCLIKHATNIPCPSCGSTRAVLALSRGDFFTAIFINPLGIVVGLIMLITPIWLLLDIAAKSDSLFKFYLKTEHNLRKPLVAIPLIALVLLNWAWNITKGL